MTKRLAQLLTVLTLTCLAASATAQVEQQKVEGSGLQQGDNFGGSVDVSGNWAIVGAAHADDIVSESGAAYVLERTSSGWVERQRLKAGDPVANSGFGYAVQIEGSTIAIGAPGATDVGLLNAGAIYVFEMVNGVWSQQQKLAPGDAGPNYGFGYSVALAGDRLIGGAIGEPHAGSHTGAAYVFEYNGATWTQAAKLIASDGTGGDVFGYSVTIDGDVAVVGATGCWVGGFPFVGAAYVFEKQGSLWPLTQTQKLVPTNPSSTQNYAYSLGVVNGSILVGAIGNQIALPNGGAVFVYQRSGVSWSESQVLLPGDLSPGSFFGMHIAANAGRAVIAAASSDSPLAIGSGYLFDELNGVWTQIGKLVASDVGYGDVFGTAVAVDGNTVLVGNSSDDDACPSLPSCDSGSAYFFEVAPDSAQYGSCGAGGPCSNVDGHGGCPNSTGQGAVLASCGSNSVAADDLVLEARWLPSGVHAIGFLGRAQTSVFLGDGRRVVAPGFGAGLYRLAVNTADAAGVLRYGPGLVAFSQGLPAAGNIAPGVQWNFQVWYRDLAGPCSSGTNTTNGVSVLFAP